MISGTIDVGIANELPMEGVDMLRGNKVVGGKVDITYPLRQKAIVQQKQ